MRQIIQEILRQAIHAPSGHNMQPWRFRLRENALEVFLKEEDQTLYNFRQRGSIISHGALVENILVASSARGVRASLSLFPEGTKNVLVARMRFEQAEISPDPLHGSILRRATNRKPFQRKTLEYRERKEFLAEGGECLRLVEEQDAIQAMAKAFSVNEQLVLSNRRMHECLFPYILWNEQESQERKRGLFLKTMELPPPAQVLFHLFRFWPASRIASSIGFAKLVAQQNSKVYASCSAMGGIIIPASANEEFFAAGRALQRVWLKATTLGLSFQPLAGILYVGQRVEQGEGEMFSPSEQVSIRAANDTIKKIFGVKYPSSVAMCFRIGYDGTPSARSHYEEPDIEEL